MSNYAHPGAQQGAFDPAAMRAHVTLDYWLTAFLGFVPALVLYLIDKDKDQMLDEHLKEVLNFGITATASQVVFTIIGSFTIPLLGSLAWLIFVALGIIGALNGPKAFDAGQTYRYPLAVRLIK